MHAQQPAETFATAARGVQHPLARAHNTGVDAEEHEPADERVGDDLERQRGERLLVRCGPLERGLGVVDVVRDDRRHLEGRGQVGHDGVQQRLDALVAQRRAGEHRRDRVADRGAPDRLLQFGLADLVAFEERDHQLVVVLRHALHHPFARFERRVLELERNLVLGHVLATLAREPQRAHAYEVDDAAEGALDAEGDLHRHGDRAEALLDHVERAPEVGAGAVHLVDEADARHVVTVGLPPHRLGLRLDARDPVEHDDAAVEHAQGALDLDREVDVAGRVDEVDLVALPLGGRRGRGDGDAALALLLHPVHHRGALVGLTDAVGAAGVVEDAFGHGRLAGIDMGDDADIADAFQRGRTGHVVCCSPDT